MKDSETNSLEKEKVCEESVLAEYGIRSLSISKTGKKKVTKESVAFCCSKSALDERDINQCTQCVI